MLRKLFGYSLSSDRVECHLCNCIRSILQPQGFRPSLERIARISIHVPGLTGLTPGQLKGSSRSMSLHESVYLCLSKLFGCVGREDGIMNWRFANCNELRIYTNIMNESNLLWSLWRQVTTWQIPLDLDRWTRRTWGFKNDPDWRQKSDEMMATVDVETLPQTALMKSWNHREHRTACLPRNVFKFFDLFWMSLKIFEWQLVWSGLLVRFQVQMSVHDFDDVVCRCLQYMKASDLGRDAKKALVFSHQFLIILVKRIF